jgi:hypothetical protein
MRWRDRRNALTQALTGTPQEIAEVILSHLGVDGAKKVSRALDKRMRAIKPDCEVCKGTGYMPLRFSTACGLPMFQGHLPCDCGRLASGFIEKAAGDRDG